MESILAELGFAHFAQGKRPPALAKMIFVSSLPLRCERYPHSVMWDYA